MLYYVQCRHPDFGGRATARGFYPDRRVAPGIIHRSMPLRAVRHGLDAPPHDGCLPAYACSRACVAQVPPQRSCFPKPIVGKDSLTQPPCQSKHGRRAAARSTVDIDGASRPRTRFCACPRASQSAVACSQSPPVFQRRRPWIK